MNELNKGHSWVTIHVYVLSYDNVIESSEYYHLFLPRYLNCVQKNRLYFYKYRFTVKYIFVINISADSFPILWGLKIIFDLTVFFISSEVMATMTCNNDLTIMPEVSYWYPLIKTWL